MSEKAVVLPGVETQVFEDSAAVATATAAFILKAAEAAIRARGRFRICLAGGSTPTAAYEQLARAKADWSQWWIYHGDERCVPADDRQRNSLNTEQVWLNQVPVPQEQRFPIPAEWGAEEGARRYAPTVEAALPFDLVLLGVGEDGHTASLFAGRPVPAQGLTMPVHDSPKPPPDRVSLTPEALTHSHRLLVLMTGSGKADVVRRWRRGEDVPVAQVAMQGRSLVYLDRAAAGLGSNG